MKISLTIPNAGAGRWCWTSWANAFRELGHETVDISNQEIAPNTDLLICTTSNPREDLIKWRTSNPDKKVALNILAWTDVDLPCINNDGVQAHAGNVEFAAKIKPNIVFAQYFEKSREILLNKWAKEGYKLGSMGMAADSTVYRNLPDYGKFKYDWTFTGGFWGYKSQVIIPWLLPVIQKYRKTGNLIGKGWPIGTDYDRNEAEIGGLFKASKVCPNVHEPHSHHFEDLIERLFKTAYCGGLVLTDRAVNLEDVGFIHGETCLIANSPAEYMELFENVLSNPEKYDTIREAGQRLVTEKHTYIHRCETLLKELK